MSGYAKDIAEWLKIDLEAACKVQDEMAIYWGADFSEDSLEVLKLTAEIAYAEMKNIGAVA